MRKTEMITVVIPTHKPELIYLQKAINSCEGIDELILHVNKGSEIDGIIFPMNYKIIKSEKNISCADALNEAITMAVNDWIIPFTDDDEFYNEALLELIDKIKNGDYEKYDIINAQCMVDNKKRWGNLNPTFAKLKNHNCIPFSSPYKKHVWEKIGGYHNEPCNDWGFWLRALSKNFKCQSFDRPLYNFRTTPNSLFKKESKQGIDNIRQQLLRNINAQLS